MAEKASRKRWKILARFDGEEQIVYGRIVRDEPHPRDPEDGYAHILEDWADPGDELVLSWWNILEMWPAPLDGAGGAR